MGADRINSLDGVRAIAVGMVIVSHLAVDSSLGAGYTDGRYWEPIVQLGQFGVYAFFILSGFVITRGLLIEQRQNGRIAIGGFFIRRAFRILPALVLYLIALKTMTLAGVLDQPDRGIVGAALFACNIGHVISVHPCPGAWVGHLWSLAYEEQFYLAFPFLFVLAAAGGWVGRLMVAAMMAFATWAVWSAAGAFFFPLRGFLLITVGVALAFFEGGLRQRLAKVSFHSMAVAFLSWPPLVAMGRMSFGLYLWQQVVTRPYPGAGYAEYALGLVALFVGCWLLYRVFEHPLIRLGARLSRSHKATLAATIRSAA